MTSLTEVRLARLQADANEVLSRCGRVFVTIAGVPPEERGPCAECDDPADVRISMRLHGTEMFFAFACPRHHDEELRVDLS